MKPLNQVKLAREVLTSMFHAEFTLNLMACEAPPGLKVSILELHEKLRTLRTEGAEQLMRTILTWETPTSERKP